MVSKSSFTFIRLLPPAQAGSLTLQKQYKYGKVLLWKYTKPMQSAAEQEGEAL